MSDVDPAAVMAAHSNLHACNADGWGVYWNMHVSGDKCEPYRLAEALVGADVATSHAYRSRDAWKVRALKAEGALAASEAKHYLWHCSACGWWANDDTIASVVWPDGDRTVTMICPQCHAEGSSEDYDTALALAASEAKVAQAETLVADFHDDPDGGYRLHRDLLAVLHPETPPAPPATTKGTAP